MKSLPSVTVVIITYDRREILRQTFQGLYDNLYYDGVLKYLIADDCTGGNYRESVLYDIKQIDLLQDDVTFLSTPKNSGWGANFNFAYQHIRDEIILLIEDDYKQVAPIDISPYVALLTANERIGNVRLDGIAGHRVVAHMAEYDISDYIPHHRQGTAYPGHLHYWLLDSGSPELWLCSNRPSLRHRRFFDYHGMYDEGLQLGATEESYAHRVRDNMKANPDLAPCIAVPLDATPFYDHIGVSYQHTELDREHKTA